MRSIDCPAARHVTLHAFAISLPQCGGLTFRWATRHGPPGLSFALSLTDLPRIAARMSLSWCRMRRFVSVVRATIHPTICEAGHEPEYILLGLAVNSSQANPVHRGIPADRLEQMDSPGRKPRQITVRAVGAPAGAGLAAFARLLMARETWRPQSAIPPKAEAARLSRK